MWARVKAWNRWAAPSAVRWPVRYGVLVLGWIVLGLAGVPIPITLLTGGLVSALAETVVDWQWARRERQLEQRSTRRV